MDGPHWGRVGCVGILLEGGAQPNTQDKVSTCSSRLVQCLCLGVDIVIFVNCISYMPLHEPTHFNSDVVWIGNRAHTLTCVKLLDMCGGDCIAIGMQRVVH